MQTLATVLLKPGEADRILAGHPWVYHGSVLRLTHPAADGELVQVKDHRQRLLGVGFYNSKSKINVRVLSPERIEVNQIFFNNKELLEILIKKADVHDGKWMLAANFGFSAANFGPAPDQIAPGAVAVIMQMGIQRALPDTPEVQTLDAAKINPAST